MANYLERNIPWISEKILITAYHADSEWSAEVWGGPFEQAELYYEQLVSKGLLWHHFKKHNNGK